MWALERRFEDRKTFNMEGMKSRKEKGHRLPHRWSRLRPMEAVGNVLQICHFSNPLGETIALLNTNSISLPRIVAPVTPYPAKIPLPA